MQRSQTGRHRQSPDLNQTKVSPKTRPTHEAGHDGQLIRPNPDVKYVLAPKDTQHPQGFEYYVSVGYELVLAEPEGVRIRLGEPVVNGAPLSWRGNFLLQCSKERADEIFLHGVTGLTGQTYQDKIMTRIQRNQLEKPMNIPGLIQEHDISELEQNPAPVFR